MSLLSSLVGGVVRTAVWMTGVAVAVGVVGVVGVAGVAGVGTAHAQDCDPTEVAKLLADDGASGSLFGISVSVDGDTAVIGAPWDDDNGGASGSAYVFENMGGVWTQMAKLLPADGTAGVFFGWSASIDGDTAVIGVPWDDDNGFHSGSAYVFIRSGGVWTQQAKLLSGDGAEDDWFGHSVSLSGDTAVIGAYLDDDNSSDSGSAYVFTRSGGVWTQQAKLLPGDGAQDDRFGSSVSLSGDTALIGARDDDDNGDDSGSAYVFTGSNGVWTQQAKLLPADGDRYHYFGSSVSCSGDTAVIGAHRDDDDSGSAYIFDLGCEDCPADLNGDGILDTRDFIAFLGAWASGDPLADWNDDGDINTIDFLAYLTDWSAGC